MAAPRSNVTAVHISLIVAMMFVVILGVVSYIFFNEHREISAELAKERATAQSQKNVALQRANELDEMKKLLGSELSEIGLGGAGPNTVLGEATTALQRFGEAQARPTYMATLQAMRLELDNVNGQLAQRTAEVARHETEKNAEISRYLASNEEYKSAADRANQELQDEKNTFRESLAQKEQDIARLRDSREQVVTELEEERTARRQENEESQSRIANLVGTNNMLRDRLAEIEQVSFEREDGLVTQVDHRNRIVWINRGSADRLTKRTAFSVYGRQHDGIGRSTGDIKGAIEVVEIVGPRLAKARIVQDDLARPIMKGDAIYTPLWSANESERIAVVGRIDLNGDGRSDREQFQDMVKSHGARIVVEVNDQGHRIPEDVRIDERVRFLVIANIPDPSEAATPDESTAIQNMMNEHKKLREEAREHGVRIVRLSDFLVYIGYTSQQQVWRPGMEIPWTLSRGARSSGINQVAGSGRESSTGATSGVFRNRSGNGPSSNGSAGSYRGGASR